MMLLVGLGNPGGKYANNRHNIGFMALDEIVQRYSFGPWKSKFVGEYCEGQIAGVKVLALKPQTYMNESGQSVGQMARFFKIELDQIMVLHDDLDLAPNKVKIKTGGGHGGHNGLRSIDAHIGKEYRRMRLGIGHPGSKEKVHGYVLGDFSKTEQPDLEKMLDGLVKHMDQVAKGDDRAFMNKFALELNPPRAKKKKDDSVPKKDAPEKKPDDPAHPFEALKVLKDT